MGLGSQPRRSSYGFNPRVSAYRDALYIQPHRRRSRYGQHQYYDDELTEYDNPDWWSDADDIGEDLGYGRRAHADEFGYDSEFEDDDWI